MLSWGKLEEEASELAERGQFQLAVAKYSAAIDQHPNKSSLYEQLAQCFMELEQHTEAYSAASQALNLASEWPDAGLTFARCALNCGQVSEAVHHFTQYLLQCSEDAAVHEELAAAQQLEKLHIARQIGIPGLTIHQHRGGQVGPGGVIWEAGMTLSRYFVRNPGEVQGKRVLELGCGTGVVGITMACLGAHAVLTDRSSTLDQTRNNVEDNIQLISAHGGSAETIDLEWGVDALNCKHIDAIAGADLIYAAKDIAPLVATLSMLLVDSLNPDVYIAHKDRHASVTKQFLDQLEAVNVHLSCVETVGAVTLYKSVLHI